MPMRPLRMVLRGSSDAVLRTEGRCCLAWGEMRSWLVGSLCLERENGKATSGPPSSQ